MEDSLTFLGITTQFIAFWLVTPQFIGKEGLNKMEKVFNFIIGNVHFFVFLIIGIYYGFQGSEEIQFNPFHISKLGILMVVTLFIILVFNKRIERFLIKKISKPLQEKFQQKHIINRMFYIGASFFVIGYFFQVTALFL